MSPLVPALLGIAALLAERAGRSGARVAVRARTLVGTPPSVPTLRRLDPRSFASPVVLGAAGFVVSGAIGACLGVTAVLVSRRVRRLRWARAEIARRDEQLADAIGALTAAVRAGMSVPQAIAYAAGEAEPPIADEVGRVATDLEVGVPLSDAVAAWAERTGSEDARLVVGALDLHRRSGGDLPAVLDQVTSTIRERVAVAREVRALTAQARLSGWILGVLPIGFFAFLWLTSRRDIEGALATPTGIASVSIGLALEMGAFLWIRSLLEVA